MNRLALSVLAVLLLAGCGTSRHAAAGRGPSLEVRSEAGIAGFEVLALTDGAPCPGVTVEISSNTAQPIHALTDVNGRAAFDVPPGEWRLRVSLTGLRSPHGRFIIQKNLRTIVTARLEIIDSGPVTICEPPDFWSEHGAGRSTFYNNGNAWPAWTSSCR